MNMDPRPSGVLLAVFLILASVGATTINVPLVECEACFGVGQVTHGEYRSLFYSLGLSTEQRWAPRNGIRWSCDTCSGRGRLSLLRARPQGTIPGRPITDWDDVLRMIGQLRSISPPAFIW